METCESNSIESNVFANLLLLNIENVQNKLLELINAQTVTLETVEIENERFTNNQLITEISVTMNNSKNYLNKLNNLKKEMLALNEKAYKLKAKASRLENYRENVLREKVLEKEKQESYRKKLLVTYKK